MRKRITGTLLVAVLLTVWTGLSLASGFNIYEAGARATALGGAFTATADDGSAMFYNAAGLSFQNGPGIDLNLMPVGPRFEFSEAQTPGRDPATGTVGGTYYMVPGAYYTNNPGGLVAYGLGVYAPFGLGVKWDDPTTWIGRQVSYDANIQTVYITPAVSFKVTSNLALAIGVDVATQSLSLEKFTLHPTLGVNALDTEISGHAELNITPTAGLMYKPIEGLSLGVMYHHKKTMKYRDQEADLKNALSDGQAGYDWSSQLLAGLGGSKQNLDADFKLPYILSFGAAYRFTEYLAFEFDYVRFGWGHFDALTMDFKNDALDQTINFNYENSYQLRFGADVTVMPEKLKIMGGYVHDKTPQPLHSVSPLLPDSDRNDYSIGAQFMTGKWEFTLSYMAVIGEARTNIEDGRPANPDPAYPVGTYKSVANVFGIGVGYNF